MTSITRQHKDLHLKAVYVAAPEQPHLDDLLKGTDLGKNFYPFPPSPRGVQGQRAFIEIDQDLVEVITTFSTQPYFNPGIFNLKGTHLDGYTALHVSATGARSPATADKAVQQVLAIFGDIIDLDMRVAHQKVIIPAMDGILEEFLPTKAFYNRQVAINSRMEKGEILEPKKVTVGVVMNILENMLTQLGVKNFRQTHNVRLVNRRLNTYQRKPTETSLLHIEGSQVKSGIYGALVSTKHSEGCPSWEEKQCDRSRAYSGFIFSPDQIMYGASVLLPELAHNTFRDQESGPTGSKHFCLTLIQMDALANATLKNIDQDIDSFTGQANLPPEHLQEVKDLAHLVYESIT